MADTQGEGANIFRTSAMNRLASADDLDRYIKVTSPSVWLVLFGAISLIVGLLVWSATVKIPDSIGTTGTLGDGGVHCFVNTETFRSIKDADSNQVYAMIDDSPEHHNVKVMSQEPLSAEEVKDTVSSAYEYSMLKLDEWNYPVLIELSESELKELSDNTKVVQVTLVTSTTSPISFLMN